MKNYLSILTFLLMLSCGSYNGKNISMANSLTNVDSAVLSKEDRATKNLNDSTANINIPKSLNDIRFGSWTKKDWYDNDYFRALRKYIDACYNGEIKNDDLEPYKSALKGKFAIGQAEPCAFGGMFIYFIFLDAPNKIFETWIYSDVDENTETVVDYQVRGVRVSEEDSQFTKDDILSIIKEHPENKLW